MIICLIWLYNIIYGPLLQYDYMWCLIFKWMIEARSSRGNLSFWTTHWNSGKWYARQVPQDFDDDDDDEEEEEQFVGSHPLLSWHAYFAQSVHECSSTRCSQNTKSCCWNHGYCWLDPQLWFKRLILYNPHGQKLETAIGRWSTVAQ